MSTDNITECPICGGNIQATRVKWMSNVILSANARDVVDQGVETGEDYRLMSIYCENDHSQESMVERLLLCTRTELEEQLELFIDAKQELSAQHIESVLIGDAAPAEWLVNAILITRKNKEK